MEIMVQLTHEPTVEECEMIVRWVRRDIISLRSSLAAIGKIEKGKHAKAAKPTTETHLQVMNALRNRIEQVLSRSCSFSDLSV
jgi:hypothetical protein